MYTLTDMQYHLFNPLNARLSLYHVKDVFEHNTFQIFITEALASDLITPGNFSWRCFKSSFLSFPIKLVKSYVPLLLPSASFFSHTWKQTPQLFIAPIRASRCAVVLSHGRLFILSALSQLITAVTRFLVKTSTVPVWTQKGLIWITVSKIFHLELS